MTFVDGADFATGLICIMLWALRSGLSIFFFGSEMPEYFVGGFHFKAESADLVA